MCLWPHGQATAHQSHNHVVPTMLVCSYEMPMSMIRVFYVAAMCMASAYKCFSTLAKTVTI